MVVADRSTRKLSLDHQIDQLKQLSRDELVAAWRKQFKSDPPKGVKRGLLERAVGYHLQSKRYGGLKRGTRNALLTIAVGQERVVEVSPQQKLVPGSRLMREWHGQTHYVDVTDVGFEWNGEIHRSLSAIALAITGTKWSGPRFFGLSS